jgi:F-type H+-transporting ATPase subunit epsilon
MSELNVDIVTPERVVYSGPVTEIRVPGHSGEFGVLAGHANYLALLQAGVATIITGQDNKRFVIGRGFAEAGTERVVILTDSYEDSENVDRDGAQRDLQEAEAVIARTAHGSEERNTAELAAEIARARLSL